MTREGGGRFLRSHLKPDRVIRPPVNKGYAYHNFFLDCWWFNSEDLPLVQIPASREARQIFRQQMLEVPSSFAHSETDRIMAEESASDSFPSERLVLSLFSNLVNYES